MLYVSCSRITIFLFYLLYANNVEPLKILLFEQYLCGNELSSDSSKEAWQETANQLAKLHLKYWGADRHIRIFNAITSNEQDFLNEAVEYLK